MFGNAPPSQIRPVPPWRRWLGPALILVLMAGGYALGLHHYLTLQAVADNRDALRNLTSAHLSWALLAYVATYTLAVALSFPGAVVLTVLGGLLFGWMLGGLAAIVSATLGGAILFLVVKTSFGESLAKKAGPFLARLSEGFAKDAFNYLLFLRLVPAFPFWLVNIAPALANVRLRTFVVATAVGIVPGTFAFAFVGQGLDSIITAQKASQQACLATASVEACPLQISVSSLVTPQLLAALAVLGIVALIPVILEKWRKAP